MSEPLSTDDIEDVVSSVRRLVSPEARPRPLSRDLGQDRLLLTPALRVVTDADASPSVAHVMPLILSDRAVEAEHTTAFAASKGEADKPAQPVLEGEWEDAFWSETEPALAELALGMEEAELLPADQPATTEALAVEPDAPAVTTEAAADSSALWAQDADEWAEEEPIPFVPLTRAASAAKASERLSGTAPKAKPVQVGTSAVEPAADAAATGLAASDMTQILTDQDGNPVTVLDEDALSQIVRLLIREELQGVLGERITHNVRKLVRAEINRALTAQSLD